MAQGVIAALCGQGDRFGAVLPPNQRLPNTACSRRRCGSSAPRLMPKPLARFAMTQLIAGISLIALAAVLGFYGQQLARDGWTRVFAPTLPTADSRAAATKEGRLAPEARFIRDSILNLAHELRLASGKQFRDECVLLPGEQLSPEKPPMALLALVGGKFTIVKSLQQVTNALAGVEGGFLFQHDSTIGGRIGRPGYERVVDEYQSLLGKPWVVAADRYRDGVPLTGNETFNICAYGLRPIDDAAIVALLSALDAAEHRIAG
jgi:hypothetical protein